jgi:hypothetical protein
MGSKSKYTESKRNLDKNGNSLATISGVVCPDNRRRHFRILDTLSPGLFHGSVGFKNKTVAGTAIETITGDYLFIPDVTKKNGMIFFESMDIEQMNDYQDMLEKDLQQPELKDSPLTQEEINLAVAKLMAQRQIIAAKIFQE